MSDFIKKALGIFVEFEDNDDKKSENRTTPIPTQANHHSEKPYVSAPAGPMSQQDIDKFTRHFKEVFDKANLDGLDYYEFSKMMDMLESTIPDETTRIATVFATLSIQGLTKDRILETARHYLSVFENDKVQFEKAAAEKASQEVDERRAKIAAMERTILDNTEMIKKLTQEITNTQAAIASHQKEIVLYDTKIAASKGSYISAYQAMNNKILSDIQKLTNIIK